MRKKIVVLGAGLVGKAMAIDLNSKYQTIAVDISHETLNELKMNYGIKTICADILDNTKLIKIIDDCDIVIGSVPSHMGFEILKNVIQAGKDIVDISFFTQDPFRLDSLAKEKNVSAIVDCGIAPGLSNIILGYHNTQMSIHNYECYVGGLPEKREWPWEYKTVFPPIECLEEYLQPGRIIENGKTIIKEPLSELDIIDFPTVGKLEGLNSDGLRTLITTMNIPNMFEKTLRYPGLTEYLKVLNDSGFFSTELIQVGDNYIKPFDITTSIIFPNWKIQPGEADITAMKISISGEENNQTKSYTYSVLDRFDSETNTTSMARTTGYTCTAVVDLILSGKYSPKGIIPPEFVGESKFNFDYILKYLEARNIFYELEVL